MSPITHIVGFQYKDGATDEQKAALVQGFKDLKQKCQRDGKPYILSLTGGKQNSPEPPSQHIHVVWNVTFASSSDRDYYVKEDPAHRAFVQDVCMQAIDVDKVIVLDFDSDEFTA